MTPRLRHEATVLALATAFLTRLPIPVPAATPALLAATPRYYPLVGGLVGTLGAGVLLIAATALPFPVAVLFALATTIALTGALHEDGLADTFDGMGAATPARALEIMRDSRIGTYGALALGLTLALKATALSAMPLGLAAATLIVAHAASRLSAVLVIATSRYLRPAGTGGFTSAGVGPRSLALAAATAALCLALLPTPGLALAAVLGLAAGHLLARLSFERRLGGYTGDCLGATQQLTELAIILALLAWP